MLVRADTRWLIQLAVACAVLCGVCIVTIDGPVAHWIGAHEVYPAIWSRALAIVEYAAGLEPWRWLGTALLVVAVLATRAVRGWQGVAKPVLFVTTSHLVATNVMIFAKHATGRLRPMEWHHGAQWLQPKGGAFPSGHISLIGSLVLPLAVLYPRLRVPAFGVLAFVGCARMAVGAHWVSDVFSGAVLAALVTWLCARIVRRLPWPAPR